MKTGEISGPIQGGPERHRAASCRGTSNPRPSRVKQGWDKAKETLLQQKREEYEGLYVENLRTTLEKEGKIKINKKEMDHLTSTEGT